MSEIDESLGLEEEPSGKIWSCKIGPAKLTGPGSDRYMRQAVRNAYIELTGLEPEFIFSGWGGELSPEEREVIRDQKTKREELPSLSGKLSREKGDLRPAKQCHGEMPHGGHGWIGPDDDPRQFRCVGVTPEEWRASKVSLAEDAAASLASGESEEEWRKRHDFQDGDVIDIKFKKD